MEYKTSQKFYRDYRSEQTDYEVFSRKVLEWNWEKEQEDFKDVKKLLTDDYVCTLPIDGDNTLTTDASKTGLEITS